MDEPAEGGVLSPLLSARADTLDPGGAPAGGRVVLAGCSRGFPLSRMAHSGPLVSRMSHSRHLRPPAKGAQRGAEQRGGKAASNPRRSLPGGDHPHLVERPPSGLAEADLAIPFKPPLMSDLHRQRPQFRGHASGQLRHPALPE